MEYPFGGITISSCGLIWYRLDGLVLVTFWM